MVCSQGVEIGQMPARAVEKEAEHLLEQLINGRTLGVFAHGTEEPVEMREQVDATQVANEGIEPGTAGQAVVGDLDIVDEICFGDVALGHPALHHMGETIMASGWM